MNSGATIAGWRTEILNGMRCVQCGAALQAAAAADGPTYRCDDCSWDVAFDDDGILQALPADMREEESANRAYYDSMANEEAGGLLARRSTTRTHGIKMRAVLDALGIASDSQSSSPKLLVELGAGIGAHGAHATELGHRYVGLDISSGLLTEAKRRYGALGEALLVSADATRTPFADRMFDGVFCVATIHHLPEPGDGIREMIRLLKPGGRFAFLEPKRLYPTQLLQYLRHPATEVSAMKMTVGRVRRWLQAAGIEQVSFKYVVYTPNKPKFMYGIFDALDRALDVAKLGRLTSVMFLAHGERAT